MTRSSYVLMCSALLLLSVSSQAADVNDVSEEYEDKNVADKIHPQLLEEVGGDELMQHVEQTPSKPAGRRRSSRRRRKGGRPSLPDAVAKRLTKLEMEVKALREKNTQMEVLVQAMQKKLKNIEKPEAGPAPPSPGPTPLKPAPSPRPPVPPKRPTRPKPKPTKPPGGGKRPIRPKPKPKPTKPPGGSGKRPTRPKPTKPPPPKPTKPEKPNPTPAPPAGDLPTKPSCVSSSNCTLPMKDWPRVNPKLPPVLPSVKWGVEVCLGKKRNAKCTQKFGPHVNHGYCLLYGTHWPNGKKKMRSVYPNTPKWFELLACCGSYTCGDTTKPASRRRRFPRRGR